MRPFLVVLWFLMLMGCSTVPIDRALTITPTWTLPGTAECVWIDIEGLTLPRLGCTPRGRFQDICLFTPCDRWG